jgi:anti-anti-sigma regulatory factor
LIIRIINKNYPLQLSALIYAANERFNIHVPAFLAGSVVPVLTVEAAERRASLVLLDRADVSSALAMHELLIRTQVGAVDTIEIDASAVGKLDCAILQLLLGWFSTLESQHIPWRWVGISETFRHVVQIAGLTTAFRLIEGVAHEATGH